MKTEDAEIFIKYLISLSTSDAGSTIKNSEVVALPDKEPYVYALHQRNCICLGCRGRLWEFDPVSAGWSSEDMEFYAKNWEEKRDARIANHLQQGGKIWSPFVTEDSIQDEFSMKFCVYCKMEQEHIDIDDFICRVCGSTTT